MNSSDFWTTHAMRRLGGSFVKALGEAARAADADNFERIKRTWPEYWSKYSLLGEQLRLEEEKTT